MVKVVSSKSKVASFSEEADSVETATSAKSIVLWAALLSGFIYYSPGVSIDTGADWTVAVRTLLPVTLLAAVLLIGRRWRSVRRISMSVGLVGVMLFLGVATISSLWSSVPLISFVKSVPLVASYTALVVLAALKGRELITQAVTVSYIIIFSVLLQVIMVPQLVIKADDEDANPRLSSLIPSVGANLLGVVALVAILGSIFAVGHRVLTSRFQVRIALGFTAFAVLLATRSRSITVIALACITLALALRWKHSPRSLVLISVSAATAVIIFVTLSYDPGYQSFLVDFLTRGQDAHGLSTLTGRTVIWADAIQFWQQSSVFGHGYYTGHRLDLRNVYPLLYLYSNLDSTWIETLVDLGVVGLVGLAVFQLAGLIGAVRMGGPESAVAFLAIVGCSAVAFVNPGIQTPTITLALNGAMVMAVLADRWPKAPSLDLIVRPRAPSRS